MANLGEPLVLDTTSRSGKAVVCRGFAVGFGLAMILGLLPWAHVSDGRHPVIAMASIMPQHQAAFGRKAFSWQSSRPQPPPQPTLWRQKPTPMQVSTAAVSPQTYGETKTKFERALPRFLDPLSQAFINDYLNDLHFYVFGRGFKYDALFALGLRELFAYGSDLYEKIAGAGEGEVLWSALCDAVGLDGQEVKKDADTMSSYAKATPPADILKNMEGTEPASDSLVAAAFQENKHSQFRSIGLFKVMEFSGVKPDKEKADEWCKAAKVDSVKFKRDLKLFKVNLRKMQQGEDMMKSMSDLEKKRKEQKKE
eukprot:gnl/TRDRNA2_/TRDRNA2_199139_c0_seq1.p1 gnl/TRDRNA2_/TRDRNA2_199139_c0~~gnl/TRDRNA2_/TRDRNA2_199139_c0_seq1.p1  ORF type:complete len:310 (+),score=67.11 gnl/TRDRNA2_/TRDRNA2_199139_c0_seq1:44-973(+)